MTDPNDDGLRMPIPPASLKIKNQKEEEMINYIKRLIYVNIIIEDN